MRAGGEGRGRQEASVCDRVGHAQEPDFILGAMGSHWRVLGKRWK